MVMPTQIDAPPAAPNRSTDDSTTFVTKMDAFLSWLTAATPEMNQQATDNNTNATAAESSATNAAGSATAAAASATSALNSPGTNATSTTSLTVATGAQNLAIQTGKAFSVGQFVVVARTSDPVNTQMQGAISAYNSETGTLSVNVTAKSGTGTYSDWTVALNGSSVTPALANAASSQASPAASSTTVLTSGSAGLQALNPQGYGVKVQLPDATTYANPGMRPFVFANESQTYALGVYDHGLNLLFVVPPREQVEVSLVDNTTANGKWRPVGRTLAGTLVLAESIFSNGSASMVDAQGQTAGGVVYTASEAWVALSATLSVHLLSARANLYAVGVDTSGATPLIGSATLVTSSYPGASSLMGVRIFAIDATHALVIYSSSTTSNYAVVLTLASTTVTVGSVATSPASSGAFTTNGYQVVQLTASTYVFVGANSAYQAIALTVSGTTVTWGAAWSSVGAGTPYAGTISLLALNSTTVVFFFGSTTAGGLQAMTVSGTTLTVGTSVSAGDSIANQQAAALVAVSSTMFVYAMGQSTSGQPKFGAGIVTGTSIGGYLNLQIGTYASMAAGTMGYAWADLYGTNTLVIFWESASGQTSVVAFSINTSTGAPTFVDGRLLENWMAPHATIDGRGRTIRKVSNGQWVGYSYSGGNPTVTRGDDFMTFVSFDGAHFSVRRVVPKTGSAREAVQFGSPTSSGWLSAYGETFAISDRMAFDPGDLFDIGLTTRAPAILSTKYAALVGKATMGSSNTSDDNMVLQVVEYANAA